MLLENYISKICTTNVTQSFHKGFKIFPTMDFTFLKVRENRIKVTQNVIETLREPWLYNFWNQSWNSLRLDDLLFSLGAEKYLLTIEYNQTWISDPGKVLREVCRYLLCQFKSFKSRNILHKRSRRRSFVLRRKEREIITVVLCYCCY